MNDTGSAPLSAARAAARTASLAGPQRAPRRGRALTLASLACALAAGCTVEPTVSLGRFELTGERTESCGDAGLLASPATAARVVHLSLVGEQALHWDGGAAVTVLMHEADGGWAARSMTVVDMRVGTSDAALPPCTIERRDELLVTLGGEQPEQATTLDASERYDFAPQAGSSCDDLLGGEEPIATALPCAIAYELQGQRLDE